jgi:hypothetical protein
MDIQIPFPASNFRPFVHLVGRQLFSAGISRLYDLNWWLAAVTGRIVVASNTGQE